MSLYRLQAGLYLSADTPHELKGWITAVTRVLDDQRRHVKKPSAKASVSPRVAAVRAGVTGHLYKLSEY